MMNNDILMSRNELVQFLRKPADRFTSDDIIRFIEAKGIRMVNYRYAAGDGKLIWLPSSPPVSVSTARASFLSSRQVQVTST